MTTTTLEKPETRLAEVARITGTAPQASVRIQLEILRKQGLLVGLNISGTGMFQKALSWVETGIADFAGDPRIAKYTKGSKQLYPEDEIRAIKSVTTRMRQLLEKHSYPVTGFYPYRWMPFTAYESWSEKWPKLIAEFNDVKARMIENRETYVERLAEEYAEIAEAAWVSITAGPGKYVQVTRRKDDETTTLDHEAFVSYFVSKTVAEIPNTEKIQAKLNADYVTALVYGDQDTAADAIEAARLRGELDSQRAIVNADLEQIQLQNSILQETARKQAWDNQTEQTERELKLEAMRQAEAERARAQLREITSPFEEVFTALRSQMATDAGEILESVKKNGFVRGKVAERGRGLVELFDLMAIQNDYELRSRLEALKAALAPVDSAQDAPERDTQRVVAILEEIGALEATASADLMSGPDRFSLLDV